jgi:lysozyme family protein
LWEEYNGYGYFKHNVNSPYLWSGTNLYSKGKFTADGKYSPTTVSGQLGAAVILQALLNNGLTLQSSAAT